MLWGLSYFFWRSLQAAPASARLRPAARRTARSAGVSNLGLRRNFCRGPRREESAGEGSSPASKDGITQYAKGGDRA